MYSKTINYKLLRWFVVDTECTVQVEYVRTYEIINGVVGDGGLGTQSEQILGYCYRMVS
jgi:hypothetical protein